MRPFRSSFSRQASSIRRSQSGQWQTTSSSATWAATERTTPARRTVSGGELGRATTDVASGEGRLLAEAELVGEPVDVGGCLRGRSWCAGREGFKTCLCSLGEGKCTLVEGESRETTANNKTCSDAECRNPYSC
jgi:hypothetical protein